MMNFRLQTTHRTTRVLPISNSLYGRGNLGRSSMNTLYSPPRASLFSHKNSSFRYEKLLRSGSIEKYHVRT